MKRKTAKKVTPKRAKARLGKHLEQINLYAAGIDVGALTHYVAVPEGLDEQTVRDFACFTADLNQMADWLVSICIQTVVMESTGVYWIPVFELLEERGLQVLLVNARHVKNVSGRKTDVLDCQWLQQLHTYGLLEGAFRPPEQVCALRAYLRQRENLIRYASSHTQHMQKALRQMNLLLDNGYVPVLTVPIIDEHNAAINTENDDVVRVLQKALAAETVINLIEAAGFLENKDDTASLIKNIPASDLKARENQVEGRMKRKMLAVRKLFEQGATRIIISDGRSDHPVTDALAGKGTVIA